MKKLFQTFLLIVVVATLFLTQSVNGQAMIINELSNGASGSKEFVEFLVTGNCGQTLDIRGWYFDDNCTTPGAGNGNGRFANITQWSAVPVGSLIVIYNEADLNAALPANDPTDADCDGVYVIPTSSSVIQFQTAAVASCAAASYTATTGYVTGTSSSWAGTISLANGGDGFQIRNSSGVLQFSVSYGTATGGTVSFATSGTGSCFRFTGTAGSDPTLVANWTANANASTLDSPGKSNNCNNAAFIEALRSVKDNEFKVSSCPNITASTTTLCPGATSAKALTGCTSDTYVWSTSNSSVATVSGTGQNATITAVGAGTANIVVTVTQTYSNLYTGLSGCSATPIVKTLTYPITVNPPPTLTLTPSCGGGVGTGIITPSFTAGAGGSPSYNPATLTGLANGDYTVTVTESGSGCTATASATINCSGGTTVTGSADGTDPCFCLTAPTLDANNNVTSNGTFGDVMTITTTPPNTSLTWTVSASTATSPTVSATFTHIGGGVYEIGVTYPAGAGGAAGTWSVTATETSGSGLPNITVSGGSLCAYTIGTLADITTPVCSTTPITLTATPTGGSFGGAGTGGTYTPAPTGSAQGPFAYSYTYDAHPAVGSNPACPLTLNADISVPACVATTCGAVAAAPIGTITPATFCVTGGALLGSDAEDITPIDFGLYDKIYLLVDNATGIIVSNAAATADLVAPDNTTTTPIVYSVYSLVYDIAQGVAITDGTSTITVGSTNVIKDTGGDALQASPTVAACMDLSPAAATTVTVNPKPKLGDDLDDATCSGASAAIDLYANVSGLSANPWTGLTVTWTAALTSGSATGFNNQTTPVTVDNNPDTFEITDVLINPSTTTPAVVTYTITPTPNANGCSGDTYVVALTVYPTLDIDFAPICSVDGTTYDLNFTISGGSGADYAATFASAGTLVHAFGSTTGTITNIPIATTSVTLEVADGNIGGASSDNCSYTETYTFTPPVLSLVPSCGGGVGTGIITPTFTAGAGGTPTYNPTTLTGLANGNYTVTVTESGSGCTATSSATISCALLCPTLTAAAPVAVVSSQSTCALCSLNGGVIAAPSTSCPVGSTLQYSTDNGTSWSTTLPTYNQTTAITVLTRCNCDVDTNVSSPTSTVTTAPGTCTPVSAGLTNNGPICSGNTATFTATPAGATTYVWSAGGSTTDMTTTAALTTDATYTVTVTAANGCASTATSTVTVNSTTAGLTNNGPICSGSTATFTATPAGATTYAWSAGGSTTATTITPTLTADATYTVTVTANGCSSSASSTVTVNALPSFTGTASCSGVAGTGSVSQTATGGTAPYTYAITGGSFGATLADGNYTVTVTDNNNCATTSTVLVNCSGALIALGNADVADPCYCITPPTLDANNVVLTTGTFGDVMIITTSPANSTLVWEVLTTTASTPIVGTNFTNNNNGTYTLNITYPAGAGGSAGSWSITATEKTGTNLPNITVSGGSGCSYVIGSLADVVAPACSAATITLTGTPSGGTWGSVATPAGTYSPTPSTVAQGPFQYTYTYDAHPAVGIHPACPLTLKADITIPACAPTCTPAAGTW